MNRDDVKAWMAQCGAASGDRFPPNYDGVVDVFAAVVALAVDAERRKHQSDIEAWKAEAATAEKWRGMALAKDPMQPGKVVQEIQREAVEREREACAQVCDDFEHPNHEYMAGSVHCAEAIRARGKS